MHIRNVSLIEHPHGGLVLVFSYEDLKHKSNFYVASLYFDEHSNLWNPQGQILHFPASYAKFSQTTYLNLMGNVQMIYCMDHQLKYAISNDYGKTWKHFDTLLEDYVRWDLVNQPIFMQMGRIVLPVYDEESGRSFAYISEDTGKTWFPSVFIEPSEDLTESETLEDFFAVKFKSPTFIQAGERKIIAYMKPKAQDFLVQAISEDFGETWSPISELELESEKDSICAIRLRDTNGIYIPTVLLVYLGKTQGDIHHLNLAMSSDVGESWEASEKILELSHPPNDLSVIQTDDNKLHIVYCTQQEIYHVIIHDITGL